MRIGICARPEQIVSAAAAGYDYVEMDLNGILKMDESEYRNMASVMEKHDIYAEVVYGMLPEDISVVGGDVSAKRIHEALGKSFEAASALGADLLVFDCAHARKLPAGMDPAMAWRQLGNAIRILQGYAADHDVRTALLPMRRGSADLMNHISEATMISAMLRLDRVGVAASRYHMAMESEMVEAMRWAGSLLWHVRVSNAIGNRLPKKGDGEDYAKILRVLKGMEYRGRVTCEGAFDDYQSDAQTALECLKSGMS